jgi:hypothetical protein
VNLDNPRRRPDPLVLEGILSGLALALTLFVVAASLALAFDRLPAVSVAGGR